MNGKHILLPTLTHAVDELALDSRGKAQAIDMISSLVSIAAVEAYVLPMFIKESHVLSLILKRQSYPARVDWQGDLYSVSAEMIDSAIPRRRIADGLRARRNHDGGDQDEKHPCSHFDIMVFHNLVQQCSLALSKSRAAMDPIKFQI